MPPRLVSIAELASTAKAPEWIVDQILPSGTLIMIAGAAKLARKSFTAMDLALATAQGLPWLGRFATRCRRVVYSSFEDGASRVSFRLHQMGVKKETHDAVRFVYGFDEETFVSTRELLSTPGVEPTLWIIDTLVDLFTLHGIQDENESIRVAAMLKGYRELAQRYDHTIIVIHHFAKERDTYRGTTAIPGSVDGWWNLIPTRQNGTIVRVEPKLRDGDAEPWHVKFCKDLTGRLYFSTPTAAELEEKTAGSGDTESTTRMSSTAARVRTLLKDKQNQRWTKVAIRNELSLSPNTVTKALETLEERGEVREVDGGMWSYMVSRHG